MKLWIDDVRPAPEGYKWVKTVSKAKSVICKYENENKQIKESFGFAEIPIELIDIDINKGTHDLTVSAVDKNNNTTTEIKSFAGVTKPVVTITVSADKKSIDVYTSHENGIDQIKLNINGQDYDVGVPEDKPKEISFNVGLPSGNNTVKVTAISVEKTETIVEETVSAADDEIEIKIEQQEDVADKVMISAKCSAGIKELKLNVNDIDYDLGMQAENPTELSFELPLVEGNNKITFTVISANGTEKQEIKEIAR